MFAAGCDGEECEAPRVLASQRLISLAPSLTEIVFALGLGDRLVGVSTHCDYPEAARAIDTVGTFVTPAVERIVAKRPDLVLVEPNVGNRQPVESLQRLGIEVLVVPVGTIAVTRSALIEVARRLGVEDRGHALVARIDAQLAAVAERLRDVTPRRTLLVVSRQPLIVAGADTLQDELIRLAGGENIGAEGGSGWPRLSIERVVAAAPEVIIDSMMGEEGREEAARKYWSRLTTLPAVRDGRVVVYGGGELLRPGPRIGRAAEELARRIHPER